MTSDLHAAVVNAAPTTGWALVTPTMARRSLPRRLLNAYVTPTHNASGEVIVYSWWIESGGRQVTADASATADGAIEAANGSLLALSLTAAQLAARS